MTFNKDSHNNITLNGPSRISEGKELDHSPQFRSQNKVSRMAEHLEGELETQRSSAAIAIEEEQKTMSHSSLPNNKVSLVNLNDEQ